MDSVRTAYILSWEAYGRCNRLTEQQCEETGSIGDRLSRVHDRGVRSTENIATGSGNVAGDLEF